MRIIGFAGTPRIGSSTCGQCFAAVRRRLDLINGDQTTYKFYRNRVARKILLAAICLLATGAAAIADPTTLVCSNDERPSDPPFKITLDQAHSTVTIVTTAQQYAPASTSTYPAIFDSQEIHFVWGTVGNQWNESIDRLTGVVTIVAQSDSSVVLHNHCHVGQAQF